ncbi:MAG TPA: lactoylglutathione lyase [Henriciella marina]|uniref:VOC family protein n=1 Tax=Henriciella sp. TaxID=1968823 RepID=UPI00180652D5|nr:VOC family protein [Henriciella sp.]HIG24201.1 lactoylglutathione lyase [Henriciella sp.]HIK65185.1 lactoylglutathione lyase [Henriciella marina]
MSVEYLHTMIRISDVDAALKFFCDGLGLKEIRRVDNEAGRFTLVFLASPEDIARNKPDPNETGLPPGLPMIELTHNWDPEELEGGRNFGHLAYKVDDIYAATERFQNLGVTINRPPRDGRMCFVRSPDGISVELLQKGDPLPPKEPWASAENIGTW